ncbi:nucleolar protein 56-like [Stegodyphus dumicola]|uniref:nucleolar protein 56-like n=1 Tax=Stegodyphus dumicola TaxID=202533 RepID=UPI0015A7A914|nr:nucleolar protein 56-like [Stegodyphus dumicola]
MTQLYVLFDHACGYAVFRVTEYTETPPPPATILNLGKFQSFVSLLSFQPFKTGRDALENMKSVIEGIPHPHLQHFLENNVPKSKKHPPILGVGEAKLGAAISEALGINCSVSGAVPELLRGIRFHFHKLVKGFKDIRDVDKAQLGLGHNYSRDRVKFNVNRIDNMIIQSISLIDQLDKDINTFSMRVREWYSFHFPELIKIVPENNLYIRCVKAIKDRQNMPEDIEQQLEEILMDSAKAAAIVELARSSMGMEIIPLDMENIIIFAERTISLMERRKELMEYLKSKMHNVAPNLATLIGDTVGARLIAHAGSLINLAKFPASTVQILGAEKALFRALKTRGNTPKYGLIYHSTFIGRAAKANKGRISRYLANKCAVASRIDCFREIPTEVFGQKLRQQVEDRLKFYETGDLPPKNIDVMAEAVDEAEVVQATIEKQIKKAKKKEKKRLQQQMADSLLNSSGHFTDMTNDSIDIQADTEHGEQNGSIKKKKKKKKIKQEEESFEQFNNTSIEVEEEPKKKKKKHSLLNSETEIEVNSIEFSGKKKKEKNSLVNSEFSAENSIEENESLVKAKKKKKRKHSESESQVEEHLNSTLEIEVSPKKKKKKKKIEQSC